MHPELTSDSTPQAPECAEPKSALVLDEHDWEVLAAICEFYIDEAGEHCHAGRALAHRIAEAACRG